MHPEKYQISNINNTGNNKSIRLATPNSRKNITKRTRMPAKMPKLPHSNKIV